MRYLYLLFLTAELLCLKPVIQQKEKPPAKQPLFAFHNGIWINLDHDLYQKALLLKSGKYNFNDQTNHTDDSNWIAAVNFYKKNLISRDLLFDPQMSGLKTVLEDQENNNILNANADSIGSYIKIINSASDYYKKEFWTKQSNINEQWIAEVEPLIAKYGEAIALELSAVYQTPWPKTPLRVDVTNYASWAGAYTTIDPVRITVGSADSSNQKPASLEVVFHEASHALIEKIAVDIKQHCEAQNVKLPRRDLWHAILFYTTGEIVKRHIPNYMPYGYTAGLWNRAWPMYLEVLNKDWLPYINKKISYNEAIFNLVKDIGKKG